MQFPLIVMYVGTAKFRRQGAAAVTHLLSLFFTFQRDSRHSSWIFQTPRPQTRTHSCTVEPIGMVQSSADGVLHDDKREYYLYERFRLGTLVIFPLANNQYRG